MDNFGAIPHSKRSRAVYYAANTYYGKYLESGWECRLRYLSFWLLFLRGIELSPIIYMGDSQTDVLQDTLIDSSSYFSEYVLAA